MLNCDRVPARAVLPERDLSTRVGPILEERGGSRAPAATPVQGHEDDELDYIARNPATGFTSKAADDGKPGALSNAERAFLAQVADTYLVHVLDLAGYLDL